MLLVFIVSDFKIWGLRIIIISVSGTTKELALITSHMKPPNCGGKKTALIMVLCSTGIFCCQGTSNRCRITLYGFVRKIFNFLPTFLYFYDVSRSSISART